MKFSIRDVLWLTVVVALVVCWGIDRVRIRESELRARMLAERTLKEAEQAIAAARSEVNFAKMSEQWAHQRADAAQAAQKRAESALAEAAATAERATDLTSHVSPK
jgi:biopolymer transport protein ExbB/TolQ